MKQKCLEKKILRSKDAKKKGCNLTWYEANNESEVYEDAHLDLPEHRDW